MRGFGFAACGVVFSAFCVWGMGSAAAESETISALHGEWRGNGTDRNSAAETATPVSCQASNSANGDTLKIKMTCNGASGREDITANLTVDQANLKGSLTRSSSDLPFAVSGSVSGHTSGNTATFDVKAFFKTRARITVALVSRTLYRLMVTDPDLGATLMHVTFRKG
jgi:hypothetical protein